MRFLARASLPFIPFLILTHGAHQNTAAPLREVAGYTTLQIRSPFSLPLEGKGRRRAAKRCNFVFRLLFRECLFTTIGRMLISADKSSIIGWIFGLFYSRCGQFIGHWVTFVCRFATGNQQMEFFPIGCIEFLAGGGGMQF